MKDLVNYKQGKPYLIEHLLAVTTNQQYRYELKRELDGYWTMHKKFPKKAVFYKLLELNGQFGFVYREFPHKDERKDW